MTDRTESQQVSLGQRLRQSREARGLSQQQVAEQLHLPLAVIIALEDERFEQLGAPIYVRGHLRSYLRLLELPQVLIEGALQKVGQAPPDLRTTTYTPRLRFLFDRYAMRAVYVDHPAGALGGDPACGAGRFAARYAFAGSGAADAVTQRVDRADPGARQQPRNGGRFAGAVLFHDPARDRCHA
jgi:hypothetical protein